MNNQNKVLPTDTKAKFVQGTYNGQPGMMLRAQTDVPGTDAVFFPQGTAEAINFDAFIPDVPYPDAVTHEDRLHGRVLNQ